MFIAVIDYLCINLINRRSAFPKIFLIFACFSYWVNPVNTLQVTSCYSSIIFSYVYLFSCAWGRKKEKMPEWCMILASFHFSRLLQQSHRVHWNLLLFPMDIDIGSIRSLSEISKSFLRFATFLSCCSSAYQSIVLQTKLHCLSLQYINFPGFVCLRLLISWQTFLISWDSNVLLFSGHSLFCTNVLVLFSFWYNYFCFHLFCF